MRIRPATDRERARAHTSRTASLSARLTPAQISAKLGGILPDDLAANGNGDGKVTLEWVVVIGGVLCAIWDYKGARWSMCDPRGQLAALFGADAGGMWG